LPPLAAAACYHSHLGVLLLLSLQIPLLAQVAGWLGLSPAEALKDTGAAADELFGAPRPQLCVRDV
jgi:hypothetical protein